MTSSGFGKRLAALLLALVGIFSTAALAWGPPGHTEVGGIADELLKAHPNAARHVHEILGDFTLAQVGPWGDCVRSVQGPGGNFQYRHDDRYAAPCLIFEDPVHRAEMEDYVRNNWSNCADPGHDGCHTQYHYMDLALQRDAYRDGLTGTNAWDVVHAINAAVAVLRGQPAPAPFHFTRAQALYMLVHLIGDLHQPLHVANPYLDANGHLVDPDASPAARAQAHETGTAGGNSLVWGAGERQFKLHSVWDGVTQGDFTLAEARAVPATPGPVSGWAGRWATQSLTLAHSAYAGLSFSAEQDHKWTVTFANQAAYDANRRTIQRAQIERAGARLAQILVSIWPDRP